jgi:predicted aldo/keto reductase-like oxidoreductase
MSKKPYNWTRRDFLKTAGAVGVGSLIAPVGRLADAAKFQGPIPTRPFGKTGANVSILSLGGMFDIPSSQLMLKQAVKWGVTYWDTAHSYEGGHSEKGIGKFFGKYPEERKKIFLVTKSGAWSVKGMTRQLDESLQRMQTDTIDLFFVHGIRSIDAMDKDVKRWGEKAKSAGKIRFFGFSTHSNMEKCLSAAPKLGWIDGIMMTYNYRLMHTDRMRRAVDACVEAGIGLTAMKTQGGGQVRTNSQTELELAGRFLEQGLTHGQAKLKAVWQNPQIAAICSQMPNMTLLKSNVGAANHNARLSSADQKLFQQYARETHFGYCAGCTDLCESVFSDSIPLGDVMRCLMYSRSYGDRSRARARFNRIPPETRRRMATIDFAAAEKCCPQKMAIGRLMREALHELDLG